MYRLLFILILSFGSVHADFDGVERGANERGLMLSESISREDSVSDEFITESSNSNVVLMENDDFWLVPTNFPESKFLASDILGRDDESFNKLIDGLSIADFAAFIRDANNSGAFASLS